VAQCLHACVAHMQVQHSRQANIQLQLKGGSLFDKKQRLQATATFNIAAGHPLCIDYAPGKLESQVWP
jgi:hypothetical protein